MDLLASLHLDGELPEQQTRVSFLAKELAKDANLGLGFNACCACASPNPTITCKACRRVKYCSEACREKDANLGVISNENDDDQAMGHSSVICALLRLCRADEDAEDPSNKTLTADQAAQDRVQSEYESYPATLANVLLDAPCFKPLLATCSSKKTLLIHVIGASVDAELWGRTENELSEVWGAYSDALQELADQNNLMEIQLSFFGPDLPDKPISMEQSIESHPSSSFKLIISTQQTLYNRKVALARPDVAILFNPGFTCPDYVWETTVSTFERGTSFIITTNTEMEAMGDLQYLLEHNLLPSLPSIAAQVIGNDSEIVVSDDEITFGENPFAGSRVRQSGTMANDVFVKNRWLLAGVFGKPTKASAKKKAAKSVVGEEESDERPAKKSKTDQNSKRSNPALI